MNSSTNSIHLRFLCVLEGLTLKANVNAAYLGELPLTDFTKKTEGPSKPSGESLFLIFHYGSWCMVQPSKQYNRDIRKRKPQGHIHPRQQRICSKNILLPCIWNVAMHESWGQLTGGYSWWQLWPKKAIYSVSQEKQNISKCFTTMVMLLVRPHDHPTRTIQPRHCSVPNDFDSLGAWEVPSCRSKSTRS